MEETLTPQSLEDNLNNEDETVLLSVSSGDAAVSGTIPGTGVDSPYTVYVTGTSETDAQTLELLQSMLDNQELLLETQEQVLLSSQRIELQNEASISILLIFLIVGLLNYIYKFFKMFF